MVYSPVNPWTFPINPNFPFYSQERVIQSITKGRRAIVTTTTPHQFQTGFNVRIFFPYTNTNVFGMYQIAGQEATIEVISSNSFYIDIDTRNFDPFTQGTEEFAQVIPISQYSNTDLLNFEQVNPPNPQTLEQVVVFQQSGLQAGGPCSTSQT